MTPSFTENEHAAMVAKVDKAMATGKGIERYCNGRLKGRKGRCRLPAGWGVPGATRGPCVKHGGTLPNVRKHHARAEAMEFVAGQMGAEVDVDLLEAPLIALRIARGILMAWQQRIYDCDGKADASMDEGLRIANMDFARISKIAVDAGVADRQIRIMERHGEQLSLLFEEMMAAGRPTLTQREAMADAWVNGLARLEAPVIDATAQDVA